MSKNKIKFLVEFWLNSDELTSENEESVIFSKNFRSRFHGRSHENGRREARIPITPKE